MISEFGKITRNYLLIVVKSVYAFIQIAVNGTTGPIHFNQDGSRDSFYIEVINSPINPNEDVRILAKYQCPSINNSNCDPKNTNLDSTDNIEYIFNSTSEEVISSIKGRNVKVIMKLGDPYLMLK